MALNHRPVFADKVTSCALCFIQFVVFSMRNPVVYRLYRTAKKKQCFADYISCYVSLNQALYHCSELKLKISRLKRYRFETSPEVRLLNKCPKICVILNFDSLECFQEPLTYCPGSDIGFYSAFGRILLFLIARQQDESLSLIKLFSKIQVLGFVW